MFRCFINIQKDANERKLTQAGHTNVAIKIYGTLHQIYGTFCVRRYQQFCMLMADSLSESRTVVRKWEC